MPISPPDFEYIAALVRSRAAIVIEPGKEYFVETRLEPLAKKLGYESLTEMIHDLKTRSISDGLHGPVIDALTTNETYFFRDCHPFDSLRRFILPQLIERHQLSRQIAVWSAACATGQEPYSLAMLIRESFPQLRNWNIQIVGSDISASSLDRARAGAYSQFEVNRGLPAASLIKHFTEENGMWVLKDDIRRMVQFRAQNLLDPWPGAHSWDIILLRNVMIYFDNAAKQNILRRMRASLGPDGLLVLGSAETTINLDPGWEPVACGKTVIYKPA